MIIRELTTTDLQKLLKLYCHLHRSDDPLPEASIVESTWQGICMDSGLQYFGVFLGGSVVSSCALAVIPNLTRCCRPYGIIENVVTHPEYRRKGFGRAVLECTLNRAWEHNCYKVMVMTGRADEGTYRFYESAGFRRNVKQAFVATPEQCQSMGASPRT